MTLDKISNVPPAGKPSGRPALPPGTRLIWSLVFVALVGSIAVRAWHAHAADRAHSHVDMHEAANVLEARLALLSPEQKQAQILKVAQDESAALRFADIDALSTSASPAAIDAIEQAFGDSDSEVRKRAQEKLIDVDKPRGLRLLLAGLVDGDAWIREDAVGQINVRADRAGKGIDKRAVPMLMKAITDPDAAVSTVAMRALSKLTGNKWIASSIASPDQRQAVITRWQTWWQGAQKTWPATQEWREVPPRLPTRSTPVPAFDVEDVAGKTFRNEDLSGKITLVNFWGTWCGPCRVEIPDLIKIDAAYRNRNVAIVGLTVADQSADSVRTWCHEHGISYRQALSTADVREAFGGIEDVPVSFLIDTQGRIRYQWDGNRDFLTFQAAIERLLHETGNSR